MGEDKMPPEKLEFFVLDPELELLESKMDQFNVFDVINSRYKETIHSAIIGWLLNHEETHALDDYFIKKFLIKVFLLNKDNTYFKSLSLSAIDVDTMNFENSIIQIEDQFPYKRRADITLYNPDENLYVLIENKILSGEDDSQCTEYFIEAKKRYPDPCKRVFIFLTPEGDNSYSEYYLKMSYLELSDVLKEIIKSKGTSLSSNVMFVLEQLLRNIEVNILEESEMDKLCLKIYHKHNKAIERIIQAKPSNNLTYKNLGEGVVSQLGNEWKYHATNSYCAVYHNEWLKRHNNGSYMSFIHYEFNDVGLSKIICSIHIEKFGNPELRVKYIDQLKMTPLQLMPNVDLNRGQVIYSKKPSIPIDEEKREDAVKIGISTMVKLINETWQHLESASKSVK